MNFLVDNQLPRVLARFLAQHGHRATHVLDLGLDEASDRALWSHARRHDVVLVSKDEDFVHIANRQGDAGRLVWVRIGNCRKQALLETFDRALPRIVAALEEGYRIVELR